ncbi:Galactoside 2-alpha-L-fucosyltransferase [Linum grandiflorum]
MDPNPPHKMRKRLPSPTPPSDRNSSSPTAAKRFGSAAATSISKLVAALLVALPVIFLLSIIFRHPKSDLTLGFADARLLAGDHDVVSLKQVVNGAAQWNSTLPSSEDVTFQPYKNAVSDKLLGGLLAAGFDESTCASRYESYLYRKDRHRKPSPYLNSKLRGYEELHKRCGPNTESYSRAVELLRMDKNVVDSGDCKYVVWVSYSGLGNRILSIAATFLYALLTDRVMLVDQGKDMKDLFCEPFPENSWLLPLDFPLTKQFDGFGQGNDRCYGKMLKDKAVNYSAESVPSYVYLHVAHDYDAEDKLFFCDDDQSLLSKVPWLVMRTDNYFVPSLFLITAYEHELGKMFPEKGTVFHHLGRYLFHPTNVVWGLITRYYRTYLAKADASVGIQVRVFDSRPGPFKHVMEQVRSCTLDQKLLPRVDSKSKASSDSSKSTAVLVTSLKSDYSDDLRNMYWENPTTTGEVVGVYQPSHEEFQQTEKGMHNRKAWAEMYLLSLTDNLVTSAWSTFGYVAQGLGGVRSWILTKTENDTVPDPPCRLAMSMDPCFHAPPLYDCKEKRGTDTGALVPHVKHCEDVSWGVKVIDEM